MYEFKMPSLGADMDSGKLVEWLVKPGDHVKKGQVIATVETHKSAVEVEIWKNGVVEKILLEPSDEEIQVGTPLALVQLDAGETMEEKEVPWVAPSPPPVSEIKKAESPKISRAEVSRVSASPAARRRARELNVDLSKVIGSGPHGVISLEDVEKAVTAQTPSAGIAATKIPEKKELLRQAIAAAMERSNREIPHYYLETTIPMRRALEWLEHQNRDKPPTERLLQAPLLLKAVALALKKTPELNGYYRNGKFEPSTSTHLGVAISLRDGGLMIPAIHDVEKKDIRQLMKELLDLVERTRKGGLRSSELTDATATVTSLGEEGVEKVFGVIYPPQVALIGLGKVYEAPVMEDGKITAGKILNATLAADHRVSDGLRGARFLLELSRLLQQPEKL